MKKLSALCLILCVIVTSACSGIEKPAPVVTNRVPLSLLSCKDEPEEPNVNTGDDTEDFKNASAYNYMVKDAGTDCRNKLARVKETLAQ